MPGYQPYAPRPASNPVSRAPTRAPAPTPPEPTPSSPGPAGPYLGGVVEAAAQQSPAARQAQLDARMRAMLDPSSPTYVGPGYGLETNEKGELVVRPRLDDASVAAQKVWAATKGPTATPAPATAPTGVIDPVTGKPIGTAPTGAPGGPTSPAPASPQQAPASAPAGLGQPTAPSLTRGAAAPVRPDQVAQRVTQTTASRFAPVTATGAPATPATGGPVSADYSRYDAAAQSLVQARDTFQAELQRLSGVDPFGNQAFIQKATDRAVAQAAGTAAMARGGAAAQAGAQRAAVGVQSQLAARGTQEVAAQRAQDEQTAAGLRLQAASGMAGVAGQMAQNEVELANQAVRVGEVNLDAAIKKYGIDAQIGQQERESLRGLATEMAKVDMARYQTDMAYRQSVDQGIIQKYVSDNALKGVLKQIEAQENISTGEAIMGILGMGAGLGSAAIMAPVGGGAAPANPMAGSDRRFKKAFAPAKTKDLQEFLATGKGEFYEYRESNKPGRRPGQNFGPMAQDLQKSKIGRTVVVEGKDGLYVDTARLALADHSALSALARRVERLSRRLGGRRG